MVLLNFGNQSSGYIVNVPSFEGPLDLLLQLIEHAKLDITKLSLAKVTDQYLHYLRNIQNHLVEELSGFLIIAAKLLQIKSDALLPKSISVDNSEDDVGESLARQLIEYKKYKNGANFLVDREQNGYRSYLRVSSSPFGQKFFKLEGFEVKRLFAYAQNILLQELNQPNLETVISIPKVTIREKIILILDGLKVKRTIRFSELISIDPTPINIVATFLALLELIKQAWVFVTQEGLFSDLIIETDKGLEADINLNLEFIE